MAVAAGQALLGLGRGSVEQDFERMYKRHAEDVFRYALLVLRSRPDAEDVTQATFIRAYRAVVKGERVRKPQHWLIKIAHNECRRHLRTASRRAVEIELDESLAVAPEPTSGPTAEEIRDALSELSFNQRAALVMRELEDRSYAEISEVLDLSVSAVETLLFRARRALREQMEGKVPCDDVELLLLKQLDGEISTDERRRLRAHTRSCATCATLERQHRGRKAALKRLGSMITLPSSLGSFFGGGGATVAVTTAGIVVGAKAAAVVVAALGVATAGAAELRHVQRSHPVAAPHTRVLSEAAAPRAVPASASRPAAAPVAAVAGEPVSADARRSTGPAPKGMPRFVLGSSQVPPPATPVSRDRPAATSAGSQQAFEPAPGSKEPAAAPAAEATPAPPSSSPAPGAAKDRKASDPTATAASKPVPTPVSPPPVVPAAPVSPPAVSPPAVSPPAVSPPAVSPPAVSPPAVSPPAVSPPPVAPPVAPPPVDAARRAAARGRAVRSAASHAAASHSAAGSNGARPHRAATSSVPAAAEAPLSAARAQVSAGFGII